MQPKHIILHLQVKKGLHADISICLACTGIFFIYGFDDILVMRPNSVHMWRQSDCASYAMNYYQNNMPFFQPQTHTLTGTNGHAASEFPLVYYIAGKLYGVLGPHEYILRLLNLLIFTAGLYALFSLSKRLTKNILAAWIMVLFVATSTYLVYYANNFLVNSSSLGLAFCGWWAFFHYKKTGSVGWLLAMASLFVLATLLKVDAGISFVAIAIILGLEQFGIVNVTPNINKQPLVRLGIFMASALLCYSWYTYATWFNKAHGTGQNLLGIFPLWDAEGWEIQHTFNMLGTTKWLPHFQSYPTLLITVVTALFLIVHWKKLPALNRQILLWLSLGCGAYFILWFRAFADHDYYLINLAILPIFVWLIFLEFVYRNWRPKLFYTIAIFLLALSVYNVYHTRQMMDRRYYGNMKESAHPALYAITPYLRSIGIERTAKIVSVPDVSPNITLYLMNNPGWTEAFNWDDYNINYFVTAGAEYLIISDSSYLDQKLYKPYTTQQVGHYQGVNIYKIHYPPKE